MSEIFVVADMHLCFWTGRHPHIIACFNSEDKAKDFAVKKANAYSEKIREIAPIMNYEWQNLIDADPQEADRLDHWIGRAKKDGGFEWYKGYYLKR